MSQWCPNGAPLGERVPFEVYEPGVYLVLRHRPRALRWGRVHLPL